MDKKRHANHTSVDSKFEDGGGTKRLKEIKSDINKKVIDNEIYFDEDDRYHDELKYFVKRFK